MRRGPACVLVVRRDRRDRSDRRRLVMIFNKNEVCVSKLPFERVTSLEKKAEHENRGKRERIGAWEECPSKKFFFRDRGIVASSWLLCGCHIVSLYYHREETVEPTVKNAFRICKLTKFR